MSTLQQMVGCSLCLVVELLFSPSLLSLHISLTPRVIPPQSRPTLSQNTVSHQYIWRPLKVVTVPSGSEGAHTAESATLPQKWPWWLFQHKLRFEGVFFFFFFTLSKEQTKENILFPGLGYCLWFIFHCFEKTCSSRFSYCLGHSLGSSVHTLGSSSSTFSKLPGLERQW